MQTQAELTTNLRDVDPQETAEWIESFESLVDTHGMARAHFIITTLLRQAQIDQVRLPALVQTPYINTIPPDEEPDYPGDPVLEKRIRRYIRWNAVAMVMRANVQFEGIGGHLSTYASAATLYEVGFNHFFRGRTEDFTGDHVFFQGHASPGIYARAFLEGRLSEDHLVHFRREVSGRGLSSYPHPYLMPDFWEYPTVSMGLGPIAAIYQARFNRYLQARGHVDWEEEPRVWAFLGDGECDEPETLGALHLAAREKLGNLIFVVNCNLQRLDGPVRGNGKIIQELEAVFHGAEWNVIKVVWGREWDPLLAADKDGLLVRRMGEVLDGDYQKYTVEGGGYVRQHFFGVDPKLLKMVEHLSDEELWRLRRGGHSFHKVYAAYQAACRELEKPTVILAKTVKGWTLGEGAEGSNVSHQHKKLSIEELKAFRNRLHLDVQDHQLQEPPYLRFGEGSEELEYMLERRRQLGGYLPERTVVSAPLPAPDLPWFEEYLGGSGEREVSTTMAFARMLAVLMDDAELGDLIVPIIPDEARTFGLDTLFNKYGIYSSKGQLYEPVDAKYLLSYREAKDGQVLEEGICEAGSMASFIAAGTSYASHGVPVVPFYIFYSMFGFQRTGDQIWASGDQRARGFLCGATAGRTTLMGEGLQHCDGHSQLLAQAYPHVRAYDPAYAYEIAVIIQHGLERICQDEEDVVFYLTLQNESYQMPAMPDGVEQHIIEGMYRLRPGDPDAVGRDDPPRVQLLGSGSAINAALEAQGMLAEDYHVVADVWSVTSYAELRREALAAERWNVLHPAESPRTPKVSQLLDGIQGPVVAVTDWMMAVPDQIARWVPNRYHSLGTDGFGLSDTRENLRRHFETDASHVVVAALKLLADEGTIDAATVAKAIDELAIDPEQPDPATFNPRRLGG